MPTSFCVTATKPVKAAIPEQGAGQLDQPQIVLVLLVVAHQDSPALAQPSQRPLDYPPPRLVTFRPRAGSLLFPYRHDVRRVLARGGRLPAGGVVVVCIQAQVLGRLRSWLGPLDHDGFDRLL